MMPRAGGPPRRPDREARAGLGPEDRPGGRERSSPEAQSGRYRPIAAQQTSGASGAGAGALRLSLPPASTTTAPASTTTMLPPISNPGALPAVVNTRQPGLPPHHDDDAVTGGSAPELVGDETATLAEYPYSIYNHGTWTANDDKTLIQARTRGQNWADLQRTHFPTKTANACRKRYERLVERRGIHDYSGRRLETVANEYMNMRKEIWSGLADRVGMKWEAVESLCMGAGLRTIQSNARSYTNRARRDNRGSRKPREAPADTVPSVDPPSLAAVPLPVGSEFGTAFTNRPPDQPGPPDHMRDLRERSSKSLMPPPPFIPAGGTAQTTRLPPMALAPPAPFGGYLDNDDRSTGGPSRSVGLPPEPLPPSRARGGPGGRGT